ncbi:MAG: aminodeoxychorismate synthase component I [Methylococcaceae bacterium]
MPNTLIYPLPYFENSANFFSLLADQPWSVFLDSGYPYSQQGRYDIFAADPVCNLVTHGDITVITENGTSYTSSEDPFDLLKQQLQKHSNSKTALPFNGGCIGYFGYDLARRLEKLPEIAVDAEHIPDMAVGIYHWAVVVDHVEQKSYLVGLAISASDWQSLIERFSVLPALAASGNFQVGEIKANMDKTDYAKAFTKIQAYLKEGDCYQVNLSQRFTAQCQGNPWLAYLSLRQQNPAPFSAYLNFPAVQVLSSSPERFLKLSNGSVETKPIKGTVPRKQNAKADLQQIQHLQASAKDRAENLMIVDLLRNDLGKTCDTGSVKVPVLFDVETYATVHHLVSTVTGELSEKQHALDLLKTCFPGGSITGAPKIRAMEIIEELEPHRRGVYCGAVGYIGFDGNMDTNIAIRTMVYSDNQLRFWAGGGIVNDSVMEAEYQECFDKAAAMLAVLKQFSQP